MTTIRTLTERIRRALIAGDPSVNDRVQDPEIKAAIGNVCAALLKLSMLSTHYTLEGGSLPDAAMIATYENIEVKRGNNGYSRIQLPAQPMSNLPERTGVFSVYPSGRPDKEFIPLPPGMLNHINAVPMYNSLNAITYTAESRYVDVHTDLLGANIDKVDMKLVIVDITTLGPYDPMPVGPDLEMEVIQNVLKLYGVTYQPEKND